MSCSITQMWIALELQNNWPTGEFSKKVRMTSDQLFVTLYTLSIYLSGTNSWSDIIWTLLEVCMYVHKLHIKWKKVTSQSILKVFASRIQKTRKQRNKNFTKNIIVFLLNNFIWTNRRGETQLCFLPIGRIFLMRFLFRCFIVL